MSDQQTPRAHWQEPAPNAVQAPGGGAGYSKVKAGLVLGVIACAIVAFVIGFNLWGIVTGDSGYMMVGAILVVPVGGLLAGVTGLVGLVLSVVGTKQSARTAPLWKTAVTLSAIGMLALGVIVAGALVFTAMGSA